MLARSFSFLDFSDTVGGLAKGSCIGHGQMMNSTEETWFTSIKVGCIQEYSGRVEKYVMLKVIGCILLQ